MGASRKARAPRRERSGDRAKGDAAFNAVGALLDDPAARCLDLPALDLAVDATALRSLRRPRRLAPARYRRRAVHELLQPRQRILAIAVLAAIPLRLDDDHAV